MNAKIKNSLNKIILLPLILIVLIGIINNPTLSLNSALSGLNIWLQIIIPSLLPFFIISEILIELGFVDFIGKLLQPMMKPLFNVPGEGIFPLVMSVLSGYPVGSRLTCRLREEKLITKIEGDRLICFTSTSGPLFILGAVSIGMLNNAKIAPLILIPHYLSVIILGLIFRFYKKSTKDNSKQDYNIFSEIQTTYHNWLGSKKSIGSLITNSVKGSMDTIILIGGLVIFYSVLIQILFNLNLFNNLILMLNKVLPIEQELLKGLIAGLFEITTATSLVSKTNSPIIIKLLIMNFLIGWGGLSVHSQAISFINNTDINSKIYLLSKFLHGLISSILGYILYVFKYKDSFQPTFLNANPEIYSFNLYDWLSLLSSSIRIVLLITLYLILFSIFIYFLFGKLEKRTN